MSSRIQKWIHFLEEGEGARAIRWTTAIVAFIALALLFDLSAFKNFNTEEAMDMSQLARNISEGKGFTTEYVRPFSIVLVEARANDKLAEIQKKLAGKNLSQELRTRLEKEQTGLKKLASLNTPHPDLANAPVYPTLLAAFLKVAPVDYKISQKKFFSTYMPEIWMAAFNQVLFFLAVLVMFKIARELFDRTVAWISAILFAATELFWRFSISGLSTTLLLLIFLCIAWTLLKLERNAQEKPPNRQLIFLALLTGVLVGVGCLTRYSFGWLILPVIIFLIRFGQEHRRKLSLATIVTFLVVISPWLARNYAVSGTLFGTAGYAVCQNTPVFQEARLERSLESSSPFEKVFVTDYMRKLMVNTRDIVENEIPRLGGSWLTALCLVGLLIPLQTPAQSRLRTFVLFSLAFLCVVQALGQTHLAYDSPQINSENLLVLASPLLFVFGVALYFNLIRRIAFSEWSTNYAANLLFCVIISAPLIFALLPPRTSPMTYPPYYPPIIQETANWMREDELMMSDVPWAVAWYGDRRCTPLTKTYPEDFFKMNDDIKPVQALYLTPKTMDARFLTQMVKERQNWGRFVLESLSRGEVPDGFPLKKAPAGFLPDQFFLTDWERWTASPK